MKALIALTIMFGSITSHAALGNCRTDGCNMRRTEQVAAVMEYLGSTDSCQTAVSSLLSLKRISDDTFIASCGGGPADIFKLRLIVKENGTAQTVEESSIQ